MCSPSFPSTTEVLTLFYCNSSSNRKLKLHTVQSYSIYITLSPTNKITKSGYDLFYLYITHSSFCIFLTFDFSAIQALTAASVAGSLGKQVWFNILHTVGCFMLLLLPEISLISLAHILCVILAESNTCLKFSRNRFC